MDPTTLVCGRCDCDGPCLLAASRSSPRVSAAQAVDDIDQAALKIARKRLLYRSRETGLLEADLILVRSAHPVAERAPA